jgi:hypothetical protein
MSVLRPRKRVLYFRVSEDEFEQFNRICESTGARSVSDLARFAMQNMVQKSGSGNGNAVSDQLAALETMVRNLNGQVRQLALSLGKGRVHEGDLGAITSIIGSPEDEVK